MQNQTQKPRRPLLLRTAAVSYLAIEWGLQESVKTWNKKAVVGGGVPFVKFGRVPYYSPDDIDAYAASKLSKKVRSTSELAAA